jgi:hypothetical protein
MRISLIFCAAALACASCVADGGGGSASPGDTIETAARRIASTERSHLQAWCAEDGHTGSDVALRVIDVGEPAEEADVLCDEIVAMEDRAGEEPVGEAEQGLTPLGLGCWAAGATIAYKSNDFCERHPEVSNCMRRFEHGLFGLGVMCLFL